MSNFEDELGRLNNNIFELNTSLNSGGQANERIRSLGESIDNLTGKLDNLFTVKEEIANSAKSLKSINSSLQSVVSALQKNQKLLEENQESQNETQSILSQLINPQFIRATIGQFVTSNVPGPSGKLGQSLVDSFIKIMQVRGLAQAAASKAAGGANIPTSMSTVANVNPNQMTLFDPSEYEKGTPGAPAGSGGGKGFVGGLLKMLPLMGKIGGPAFFATQALNIGRAVNTYVQQQKAVGAQTGEGFKAGVGVDVQAFKMGVNPFDMMSGAFAREIIQTFRSKGFRGDLANSLSESFGEITNKMGESLSRDLLPIASDFASAMRTQGLSAKDLKKQFDDFSDSVKTLFRVSKDANVSTKDLNAGFATLAESIIKLGGKTSETAQDVTSIMSQLFTTTEKGKGGVGLSEIAGIGAPQIAQMITQAAPFLAGRAGIPAPLALVGGNVKKVQEQLIDFFAQLYKSAPSEFQSTEGLPSYAAYLLAGVLPGVGMGNFTVDQVVALLNYAGKGSGGGGTGATKTTASDLRTKNYGFGQLAPKVSGTLTRMRLREGITMETLQQRSKYDKNIKEYLDKGGKLEDLLEYSQQRKGMINQGSLESYMRQSLASREIQSFTSIGSDVKQKELQRLNLIKQASLLADSEGGFKEAYNKAVKEQIEGSNLFDPNSQFGQIIKSQGGLREAVDIVLTLDTNASSNDSKLAEALFGILKAEIAKRQTGG